MAKGKKGKRQPRGVDRERDRERVGDEYSEDTYSDDDSLGSSTDSQHGAWVTETVGPEVVTLSSHDLGDALDGLTEKREATRLLSLERLTRAMQQQYAYDWIDSNRMTIADNCVRCLRTGKAKEKALAAMAIGVAAISLGADCDELVAVAKPLLLTLITDAESSATESMARALAIIAFVGCDTKDAMEVMDALKGLFKRKSAIAATAVECWALLASSIPVHTVVSTLIPDTFHTLSVLLGMESINMRVAAAESICLLAEMMATTYQQGFINDFTIFEMSQFTDIDELVAHVNALSTENTKRTAKSELSRQKKAFRRVKFSLLENEPPYEKIEINKIRYDVCDWVHVYQTNAFRLFLGGGFHVHLASNDLLSEVLGHTATEIRDSSGMSSAEKRFFKSPNSEACKNRTRTRQKQRDVKHVVRDSNE